MPSSSDHYGIQSFRTSDDAFGITDFYIYLETHKFDSRDQYMMYADKIMERNGVPMEPKVIRPDNLTETREFAWYQGTFGKEKL